MKTFAFVLTALVVLSLSGCARSIDEVNYRSDGTYHDTVWGTTEPAPASAQTRRVTPQDPGEAATHQQPADTRQDEDQDGQRLYYRAPNEDDVSERERMLMKMSEQMQARAPDTPSSESQVQTQAADRAPVESSAPARVALRPMPGTNRPRSALIDNTPSAIGQAQADAPKADQGRVPAGDFQVFIDFDADIPTDALMALLDIDAAQFASRVIDSGDRRVFLGAFNTRQSALNHQAQVEATTGLAPQVDGPRS